MNIPAVNSEFRDGELRHNWTREELRNLFDLPFADLVYRAHCVHRMHFYPNAVQISKLLSIKTGGCPEDCAYCPQSAHYETGVSRTELVPLDELIGAARQAREQGATRFCMGAAWRDVPDTPAFEQVLEMVR